MKTRPMPPIEVLKEYFSYSDGKVFWIKHPKSKKSIGNCVGYPKNDYLVVKFQQRVIYLHRLIWFLNTGIDPVDYEIDHKNCDKSDNRFENLRLASHADNAGNTKLLSLNKSGVKGVSWSKLTNSWRARIRSKGKETLLGYFSDPKDAIPILEEYRKNLHGEFANNG